MKLKLDDNLSFLFLFILALLWFNFGIDMINSLFGVYAGLFYIVFMLIYTFLAMRYLLKIKWAIRVFIALFLVFLAWDLFVFPMMIPKEETTMADPSLQTMSADYALYSFISQIDFIPHWLAWQITYPVMSVLMVFIAWKITTKKEFNKIAKSST